MGIMSTSTPTAVETEAVAATPTPAPTADPTTVVEATWTATETVAGASGVFDPLSLPPGALFFLGGLVVLVVGFVLAR
jgi:hypothetical protein